MTCRTVSLPETSPFSKSPSACPIWFVTWAKQMIWYCLACESRVEGGRLHFYCQDAFCAAQRDQGLRLPKRRISRPACAYMQENLSAVPVCTDHFSQGGRQIAVRCGRQIMVARPLVA